MIKMLLKLVTGKEDAYNFDIYTRTMFIAEKGHAFSLHAEKYFRILDNPNQIWIVITLFR